MPPGAQASPRGGQICQHRNRQPCCAHVKLSIVVLPLPSTIRLAVHNVQWSPHWTICITSAQVAQTSSLSGLETCLQEAATVGNWSPLIPLATDPHLHSLGPSILRSLRVSCPPSFSCTRHIRSEPSPVLHLLAQGDP